ncbi:hypothetical protein Pmani_006879 [Petrolisthes manimaculis]|uniref:Uncharacterized protein n=1 Tax=Petrolisthes manimaculis TaxID=1843537 RepID=A0AAE1Q8X1_9EUCA|nr:hypothetical protein Pmani_010651 [Petrolisthes manimaculis]KAK4322365.1 hypothetical protein Pmani_006879 [Petrolisthes manimaculis]
MKTERRAKEEELMMQTMIINKMKKTPNTAMMRTLKKSDDGKKVKDEGKELEDDSKDLDDDDDDDKEFEDKRKDLESDDKYFDAYGTRI